MFRHRVCGLSVTSDFVLTDLPGAEDETSAPDVVVRAGAVPPALPDAFRSGPAWQLANRAFQLDVPAVARFLVRDGREVVVDRDVGASDADVSAFLRGTVLAALLFQRGQLVLHGATVCLDGRGVVICGRSGSGKSTLAAALCASGAALVGDDIAAIRFEADGTPTALSDGRSHRLWAETVEQLNLSDRRGARVRQPIAKFHVAPFGGPAPEAVPLATVVLMRESPSARTVASSALEAADAAALLSAETYRRRLARTMRPDGELLRDVARLVARTRVVLLERPMDFALLDDAVAAVVAACRSERSRPGAP